MNALPALILSVILQAGPAAAADAPRPAAPKKVPERAPDQAAQNGKNSGDRGLQQEIGKLAQLEDEIRALLEASEPDASSENVGAEAGGKVEDAGSPAEDVLPAQVMLNAMAAADALYLSGKYAEALAFYDKVVAENANDTCWCTFQKANCQRRLGHEDEALNLYQEIVTGYPDNFWAAEAEWWMADVQWKADFRER